MVWVAKHDLWVCTLSFTAKWRKKGKHSKNKLWLHYPKREFGTISCICLWIFSFILLSVWSGNPIIASTLVLVIFCSPSETPLNPQLIKREKKMYQTFVHMIFSSPSKTHRLPPAERKKKEKEGEGGRKPFTYDINQNQKEKREEEAAC